MSRRMPGAEGVSSPAKSSGVRAIAAAVLLAALVVAVFHPVTGFSFLGFDDTTYITTNPMVRAGLTLRGASWALTTFEASNWHPLTWFSHMLDAQVYGVDPAGHHRTNLLLHLGAVLLLFAALRAYTGSIAASLVAAALFGVHPLRAESVAWVSERKDVLSALLWMATILAYLRWVRRPGPARYFLLCSLFALGLAAKPMLVTLPFVLLLLDWWPLGRLLGKPGGRPRFQKALSLLGEKTLLFILAAGSAAITMYAQHRGGAMAPLQLYTPGMRAANALDSYAGYLGHFFFPSGLAFHYPFPVNGITPLRVAGAALLLSAVTVFVAVLARRVPALVTGWLWYVGTLVPVIGLVQVGGQASADRYTYIPSVGLGIALVWAGAQACRPSRRRCFALLAAGAVVVLVLAVAARRQVATWRDTETLARHALRVNERSWMGHFILGSDLLSRNERLEAIEHLEASTRLNPGHASAWSNLGSAYAQQGRFAEAEHALRQAVRFDPRNVAARFNLGVRLMRRGDRAGAIEQQEALRRLDPVVAESLGNFLRGSGAN